MSMQLTGSRWNRLFPLANCKDNRFRGPKPAGRLCHYAERGDRGILALCGWVCIVLLGLLFFAAVSLGLLAAYRWTTAHPFFEVQNVDIAGLDRLAYGDVSQASGVRPGMNILALNMHEVERGLMANPWIESVSVSRSLPGTIAIQVHERVPRYWVRRGDALFYADGRGNIIDKVEPGRFVSLPLLRTGEATAEALAGLQELTRGFTEAGAPFSLADAAWIRISPAKGFEVYLEAKKRIMSLGIEDLGANLERLKVVVRDLDRRGELERVRSIRAHGSNVWVYRNTPEAGA